MMYSSTNITTIHKYLPRDSTGSSILDEQRTYGCMVPLSTTDGTPLLVYYGGTAKDAKDPLDVAEEGLSNLQVFNLANNKWFVPTTDNMPESGPILPGCGLSSNDIWVYDPHYGTSKGQSTSISLLDVVHYSWSVPRQQGQLPVTRFGAAFAYVPSSQTFYMHGGVPLDSSDNVAGTPPGIANNLDIFSIPSFSWDYASNGPARKYHTFCYISSIDSLVLFGGSDQNIVSYNDIKVFTLNPAGWKYDINVEAPDGMPSKRVLHSAVCTDNEMYVFGGSNEVGSSPSDSKVWMLKANSSTHFTWSPAPISSDKNSPSARVGHAAALYKDAIYIYGGISSGKSDSSMYRLDLKSWEWSKPKPLNDDGSDSNGGGGRSNTSVIVAAVVSAVFGIIAIGIASAVIYRCHRRKNTGRLGRRRRLFFSSSNDTESDNLSESAEIDDNHSKISTEEEAINNGSGLHTSASRRAFLLQQNKCGFRDSYASTYDVLSSSHPHNNIEIPLRNSSHDYSTMYKEMDCSGVIDSSGSTAANGTTPRDIVANNYLPSPHANPSLGSSISSFLPPITPMNVVINDPPCSSCTENQITADTTYTASTELPTNSASEKSLNPADAGNSPTAIVPTRSKIVNSIRTHAKSFSKRLSHHEHKTSKDLVRPRKQSETSSNKSKHKLHGHNNINISTNTDETAIFGPTRQRIENEYRYAEAINEILLSGQPIPQWLREAINRAPTAAEPHNQFTIANIAQEGTGATSGNTVLYTRSYDKDKASIAETSASRIEAAKMPLESEKDSTYSSKFTNDAQSALDRIPIRYMDPSLYTVSEASQLNEDNDVNSHTAEQGKFIGSIAMPMAPPIPPNMNSIYGELEQNGIFIGQAGMPPPSRAISSRISDRPEPQVAVRIQKHSQPSSSEVPSQTELLSPLDRIAQYRSLDIWTSIDDQERGLNDKASNTFTDDTSKIYRARPANRESNES